MINRKTLLRYKIIGRSLALIALDMIIITLGYYLAFWIRLDVMQAPGFSGYMGTFWETLPWLLGIRFICGFLVRQYTWSFGHASLAEAFSVANATVAGSLIFGGLTYYGQISFAHPPRSTYFMEFTTSLIGMGFIRFFPRYACQLLARRSSRFKMNGERGIRTLIFGAGHTGELLARDILRFGIYPYHIIGFVDDDTLKLGTSRQGLRVLGGMSDLHELVRKHDIHKILLAAPDLPPSQLRELVDICSDLHVRFKVVPPISDIIGKGPAAPIALEDLKLEDLLDRAPVEFDQKRMAAFFVNKVVLVTGAAGSIGSEICRQVAKHGAKRLVALDVDENNLYMLSLDMRDIAPEVDFRLEIATIREQERIDALFKQYKPDIVFHAAAHKHVPLMEYSPTEALKNNVLGTRNVAVSADRHGVQRFVLISTDKAVKPTNIMGASKWLAETVVRDMNDKSKTEFMAVRFGNVLGSNGSLIPILKRQIAKGGPVTITHPDITRYFMTIPEAVGLVLISAVLNEGALCVLDMGELLSVDKLARAMISLMGLIPDQDIKIHYTGLRPGEKMYEELFTGDEQLSESEHPKIRVAVGETQGVDIAATLEKLELIVTSESADSMREYFQKIVPGCSVVG